MRHPLHLLLERLLNSGQFARDAAAQTDWLAAAWASERDDLGMDAEVAPKSGRIDGTYRERET
ncbi:MAG: hypothetical protein ACREQZ_08180, partial [Woeseiaceae bacterium]